MSQAFHGGRLSEARTRFGPRDFLDFSVNTNPFWTAPTLLSEAETRGAWTRYPEADAASLSMRLSALWNLSPAHLQATAGAIEALYLSVRLFRGKSILLPQPAFADYARACTAAEIPFHSLALPPEARTLTPYVPSLSGADVVVLGTPVNPTGTLFEDLGAVIADPRLRHISWILDEAFIDFTPGGAASHSFLHRLEAHPNVLILGALTKSWGLPGLRLGFVASSHPQWMQRLRSMQPPWSIHGYAERWALAEVHAENLRAMQESLKALPAARAQLSAGLNALPGLDALASDANYLLVRCSGLPAPDLAERLGHRGMLVRVCHGFQGLDPARYLRIAVRRPEENSRLLKELGEAVSAPRPRTGGKNAGGTSPDPLKFAAETVCLAGEHGPRRPAPDFPRGARQPRNSGTFPAISVLGTSSNSGKSWLATALCALLHRRGLRVAPFKAQNMSNNSAVAWDGGEIGRAQAAQAEACGQIPSVRMNPVLLKPSGASGSQLIVLGKARGHVLAGEYYRHIEGLWPVVAESLEYWKARSDVMILEGAGSPVELNLLERDLVNFRPVRHLNGRWLLVADIERGGVFAQAAGTWALTPESDRKSCLGLVVNKFRGDLGLFSDAQKHFAPHFGAPYFGTLPFRATLQPEGEDSLCLEPASVPHAPPGTPALHWVRFPHISNAQDAAPWHDDTGVALHWTSDPGTLAAARVVVLPGSKNTIADLAWLHETGLAAALLAAHAAGAHIVGICGGFQMLGEEISDPAGLAGDAGTLPGVGLLPARTVFSAEKEVRNVVAEWRGERWTGYEIHMGRTHFRSPVEPMLHVTEQAVGACCSGSSWRGEGAHSGRVWGTYVHGLFESTEIRKALAHAAGAEHYGTPALSWRTRRRAVYNGMADLLEEHLHLEPLWRYVAH